MLRSATYACTLAAVVASLGGARADDKPAAPAAGPVPMAAPPPPREHPMKCTVRVIHALKEGNEVKFDAKIHRLRPYLEKEPFTGFKQFHLLDSRELLVRTNGSDKFALPNGKQVTVTYLEHVTRADGKHRVRLRFEIDDATKKILNTTFVLDEGGVVIQAGQKHGAGLLVLGISCEST